MRVGAPFNPYRVFQGVFAPYWILEHRGIGTGAKLCYIRLLGFAGKDARCYPSLETLGTSLGVSDRQARDYVKELERSGLITVEQRGLRKTNVYLFLWTEDLERLTSCVPDRPTDPQEPGEKRPQGEISDGNDYSDLERNRGSAPERNNCSGLDRKHPAGLERKKRSGPIGINSEGISSVESSSSSSFDGREDSRTKKTIAKIKAKRDPVPLFHHLEVADDVIQTISKWAEDCGLQRFRNDRRLGLPDEERLREWAAICQRQGIDHSTSILGVLSAARAAADRSGDWRNWSFLTLQVQLAAEKLQYDKGTPPRECWTAPELIMKEEDTSTEWAKAKSKIRAEIPEIPFSNWFAGTRQIRRGGTRIDVEVPDEPTRSFLETEYAAIVSGALSPFGINEVCYCVRDIEFVKSA